MTLNDETTERHGNGHRHDGDGVIGSGHADLESVCRNVTELARAAARPPCRIVLRHGQTTVEMEWPHPDTAAQAPPGFPPAGAALTVSQAGLALPPGAVRDTPRTAAVPLSAADLPVPSGLDYVCATTVGTFYHSPEPGAPPFVSVGEVIRPGQPVGILEVMKMMSTVEADTAGRVVEILVPDGGSVEYQQRLIALEPCPADRAE